MAALAPKFNAVVAATRAGGIGRNNNTMPWRLPGELKRFKELTSSVSTPGARNAVIMGRKTYECIPPKFRPLPQRLNVVLTRSVEDLKKNIPEEVLIASSLEQALKLSIDAKCEHIFVIGGAQLFAESFTHPMCERVFYTRVETDVECDIFIPPLDSAYRLTEQSPPTEEGGITYRYLTYVRDSR